MFEKTSDLIFKKIYGAGRRKPDPDVLRKLMFLNPFTDAGETYRIFCTKRIRMVLICLLAGIILFIRAIEGSYRQLQQLFFHYLDYWILDLKFH